MKKNIKSLFACILFVSSLLCSCEVLDTKEDLALTDEMMKTRRYQMFDLGYRVYEHVPHGFTTLDANLFATVTDEAQYVSSVSMAQRFNEGSWGLYYNPNDHYSKYYNGINAAYDYIVKSEDYKNILAFNRDMLTSGGKDEYLRDVLDVERLRAESRILKAFYYFELAKRFGGVPLIEKVYSNPMDANLPRNSFDEIITFLVKEIDNVLAEDILVDNWSDVSLANFDGRVTTGVAMTIKAKALLYAASPLFNPSGDQTKWVKAVVAMHDVIDLDIYSLDPSYGALFVSDRTNLSPETIWAVRLGATNDFERNNYPIGTPGGGTGVCPSQNLVDAYEYKGALTSDMYANRDPRFYATIVKNQDEWNGRTMEIYSEGKDDPNNKNTSITGYYLKKFLNPNLDLINDAKEIRSWIVFRYADILLSFAEAMNEAYGPDDAQGYSMTARAAINAVRSRSDVGMPDVSAPSGDVSAMRLAIKHERQIELAFEEHRYWDLKRWDDAKVKLNAPLRGIQVTRNGNDFIYTKVDVAKRVFEAPKMNLYPIPQAEIVKSNGVLTQNPLW